MNSGRWQDLTTEDFAALDVERTVALLPVAAIEQHGPHLPLSTDAAINEGILEASLPLVSDRLRALALPPMVVGASVEHESFPGTLSVAAEHLLPAWLDIGRSVARAGVRKLVIFNTHGGQKALVDLAAASLRAECDLLVVRASYFAFGAPEGLFESDEWMHGIHGGEVETSLMLHLKPHLVRTEALADFASLGARLASKNRLLGVEKPIGFGWKAQDLNPAGVCGNAANADAARGAQYLSYLAAKLAALLEEVAATPLGIIAG